jgi:hypothetical protein
MSIIVGRGEVVVGIFQSLPELQDRKRKSSVMDGAKGDGIWDFNGYGTIFWCWDEG